MKHENRVKHGVTLAALVPALAAGFTCASPRVADSAAEAIYPGAAWERISDPSSVGFSAEALDAIHPYVDGINTSAVMAVVGGRVLFEHGPVDSLSYLASVRKSILAMLYGNYVEDGTIDLDLTLEELGMDDAQGLLPVEKRRHLVAGHGRRAQDRAGRPDAVGRLHGHPHPPRRRPRAEPRICSPVDANGADA